ncbi:hypothetical protein GCM10023321_74080 [Pseudonocardia eucalypti]|uniref:Uncharacterized protein n=1 Tax=Pseudonocardia eucalypti TaxID=648755 RepID=A0ABP9R9M6_9PSEU|nr:hypothetical protein [Pseudonocardia eucalypti]
MHTTFRETMSGTVNDRPLELRLAVDQPGILNPVADRTATLTGRLRAPGIADDVPVTGTLRIAPLNAARTIGYDCSFSLPDGRRLRLAGAKTIELAHPLRSMTTLPVTLTEGEKRLGDGVLRFDLRDLPSFLAGFRLRPDQPEPAGAELYPSRWRGQPGRLEVWYSTFTDPATGTGVWLHHELVAPADGGLPRVHGWTAVYPPGEAPVHERFGPIHGPMRPGPEAFSAGNVAVRPGELRGAAGELSWKLTERGGGKPLYTLPAWAWRRELLPSAHLVTAPGATFDGVLRYAGRELVITDAPGASARIYGHGNALRWAWLHADLGDGEVLEVVTAVSKRPVLRALKPLTFLRLRHAGADWPAGDQLVNSFRYRSGIDLPSWWVSGRVGDRRIRVRVHQPPEATLALDYTDPDGEAAVCRNCECADATVLLERRVTGDWRTERRWRLDGTAHAEVGGRG